MSHRRAKRIRQQLLPRARQEAGASRGKVIRTLTEYMTAENSGIKKGNKTYRLVLKPGCPRDVIQRAKRYANQ